MIWNWAKYLEGKFPKETFYYNVKDILVGQTKVPDRIILIKLSGGTPIPVIKNTTDMLQVICRDRDAPKAYKLAEDIFNDLNDRYGLILPQNKVDGIVYPAKQVGQISANTRPQSLGDDEQGRAEFVINFRVIYRMT